MSLQLAATAIAVIVLIPLAWRRPAVALYVLIGAAVTIEIFPLGFSDSLTDTIPFFLNLNTGGVPLPASPAEGVMVLAVAAWLSSSAGQRGMFRPNHSILRAYLA